MAEKRNKIGRPDLKRGAMMTMTKQQFHKNRRGKWVKSREVPQYFCVSTLNQQTGGWFIVSGPHDSRGEADHPGCKSSDIYDVTEYRNAQVVTWNQMKRLRVGSPSHRIGEEGRWRMWQEYDERARVAERL